VLNLGRRRRRVAKVVKKKLPKIFVCPACGEESVRVNLKGSSGKAVIQCGSCKIKDEFEVSSSTGIVDVYCRFTDRYRSNIEAKP
jgi:transcription elongation factor Elf1